MFIRDMFDGLVGILAFVGLYAIYTDAIELPSFWWLFLAAYGVGCALKSLTRSVPVDILDGHKNALALERD